MHLLNSYSKPNIFIEQRRASLHFLCAQYSLYFGEQGHSFSIQHCEKSKHLWKEIYGMTEANDQQFVSVWLQLFSAVLKFDSLTSSSAFQEFENILETADRFNFTSLKAYSYILMGICKLYVNDLSTGKVCSFVVL